MKNKMMLFLFALTLSTVSAGEPRGADPLDANPWFEQGNLFSLKVVPKDRSLQVFVVGHEVHSYRPEELEVEAYVMSEGERSALPVEKKNGSFLITPPDESSKVRLKMRHLEEQEEIELRRK